MWLRPLTISVIHRRILHGKWTLTITALERNNDNAYRSPDFGDLHYTATVCEPAIACAYIALNKKDPLAAMAQVVGGYHDLEEREIEALFPLILLRLAVSVVNSAHLKSEDPYTTISEKSAWEALRRLLKIHPRLAHYVFRHACGLKPLPDWVSPKAAPVMHHFDSAVVLDMTTATEMPSSPAGPAMGDAGRNQCPDVSPLSEQMFEGRVINTIRGSRLLRSARHAGTRAFRWSGLRGRK